MKKSILTIVLSFLFSLGINAQLKPALHVEGNQLRDAAGNKVVLHGVMDSPNPSVNGGRWGIFAIDDSIPACLDYFDKLFDALSDADNGGNANVIRLHLDPIWTNNPNLESDGQHLGEADISRFSVSRLKNYLKKLYCNIAESALAHGLYVIMRPPGICHGEIIVGGDYQTYLLDVWDIISSNSFIQEHSGQISFELASNPVIVSDAKGKTNAKAVHDFFQPIVDKIRENEFDGVIWVPAVEWQTDCRAYAQYPIMDDNFGFSVYNFNGAFGVPVGSDVSTYIRQFEEYVPVVNTNPIMVTEVDWSPENEAAKFLNDKGEWVYPNFGTRNTATTEGFGVSHKAILDYYGNIGMTVASSGSYINIDKYMSEGVVSPAFPGLEQACGEPLFAWYKDWAKVNYPSNERYQPYQVIPDDPFAFEGECFTTNMLRNNSHTEAEGIHTFGLVDNGSVGWRYEDDGISLAAYDSLVVEFAAPVSLGGATLNISCSDNYWNTDSKCTVALNGSSTRCVIPLHSMVSASGVALDENKIKLIYFNTQYAQDIAVKSIQGVLTSGIETVKTISKENVIYDLTGRAIDKRNVSKGIYISNGIKVRF